jgi:protein TonB
MYTSANTENLLVRLDVFDVANVTSESFRSQPNATSPVPANAAGQAPDQGFPVVVAKNTPAMLTPPKVVTLPRQTQMAKVTQPAFAPAPETRTPEPAQTPPSDAATAPPPEPAPAIPHEVAAAPKPVPQPVAIPAATVTLEEAGENRLQKAIHVIPGLRKLDKRREADYVAPVPVRQTTPTLPNALRGELTGDVLVSVKVSIDNDGSVSRADLLSNDADGRLTELALNAARQWRFNPARVDTKRTTSKMVLRFRFHPSPAVQKEGPKIANRLAVNDTQLGR